MNIKVPVHLDLRDSSTCTSTTEGTTPSSRRYEECDNRVRDNRVWQCIATATRSSSAGTWTTNHRTCRASTPAKPELCTGVATVDRPSNIPFARYGQRLRGGLRAAKSEVRTELALAARGQSAEGPTNGQERGSDGTGARSAWTAALREFRTGTALG